jgi:hypothetical protein
MNIYIHLESVTLVPNKARLKPNANELSNGRDALAPPKKGMRLKPSIPIFLKLILDRY